MMGLTARQNDCLQFVKTYARDRGIAPSLDEIAQGMGIKSKSGVNRILEGLQERGVIRRIPHRARCIEIIDLSSQVVHLNAEIYGLVREYAVSERIGIETAVNALLRDTLGAAA